MGVKHSKKKKILITCLAKGERLTLHGKWLFNEITIIFCSWNCDVGMNLCIFFFFSVCMLLCCHLSAGGCVFAFCSDHVARFADWSLGHTLRLFWCSIEAINIIAAVHGENMVSGEVENRKERNEVNDLFLGPSLNRITNDFSVTNGVFYSLTLALAHIHNPFLSCLFNSLIFFILLHVWAFFLKLAHWWSVRM